MKYSSLVFVLIVGVFATSASAMYNPRVGGFIQRDPAGYRDGPNVYAYVQSNPVNAVDPSGTVSVYVEVSSAASESQVPGPDGRVPVGTRLNPDYEEAQLHAYLNTEYQDVLDTMIADIEGITDEQFEAFKATDIGGQSGVTWEGEDFEGTRQEYLDRLRRERESAALLLHSGELDTVVAYARTLSQTYTEEWDEVAFLIHGARRAEPNERGEWDTVYDENNQPIPTGNVGILGEFYEQASTLARFTDLVIVASCYQESEVEDGVTYPLEEKVGFVPGRRRFEPDDCQIGFFTPQLFRERYRHIRPIPAED